MAISGGSPGMASAESADPIPGIQEVQELGLAWSGTHVGFDFLTQGPRQFVAFYGPDRHMTVASRLLGSGEWRSAELPSQVLWDSHDFITLAVDRDGHLHVAGNMHVDPLVYFRTTAPGDVTSLRRIDRMVGRDESSVTYPQFLEGPQGELLFLYREGTSGRARHFVNAWDPTQQLWQRLSEEPLFDYGGAPMNAYPVGPLREGDYFHLTWVWRDGTDARTNHDLSYARSRDLVHWETSAGEPIALPMVLASPAPSLPASTRGTGRLGQPLAPPRAPPGAEVIDPIPVGGGIINGNVRIGFDRSGRVIVSYHRYDAVGNTQIYSARREAEGWRIYQVTDWRERWEIGGSGTLEYRVRIGAVGVDAAGALVQSYAHWIHGSGTWVLDEETLRPVGEIATPNPVPAPLRRASEAGLVTRIRFSRGDDGEVNRSSFLRWETLPRNGDVAPLVVPPPSPLRLYQLVAGGVSPGCARDRDRDGVCDDSDNCLAVWNPDQIDADADGYGNRCDADYDGDGIVGAQDVSLLRRALERSKGDPDYQALADHDSNDRVDWADALFCARELGRRPGPSGLACAGRSPCP